MTVYPFKIAQIRLLKTNKASTIIIAKNSDYIDVFWLELAIKLLEHTGINNYIII